MNLIRITMVYIVCIICLEITRNDVRLMRTMSRINIKFKVKKLTVKLELRFKILKVGSLATNNLKAKNTKTTRINLSTKAKQNHELGVISGTSTALSMSLGCELSGCLSGSPCSSSPSSSSSSSPSSPASSSESF